MSSIFERIVDHGTKFLERNQKVERFVMNDADLVEVAAWITEYRLIGDPPSPAVLRLPDHPTSEVLLEKVANELTGAHILGVPLVAKRLLTTVQHRPNTSIARR